MLLDRNENSRTSLQTFCDKILNSKVHVKDKTDFLPKSKSTNFTATFVNTNWCMICFKHDE